MIYFFFVKAKIVQSLILSTLLVNQPGQTVSIGSTPWEHPILDFRLPRFTLSELYISTALELSDLPPRFKPVPPALKEFLFEGIAGVKPYLDREGISLEEATAFANFANAEMVIGLTFMLSDQPSLNRFDSGLNSPDASEQFVWGLKQSLQGLGAIKVKEVRELPLRRKIGNIARGMSIKAEFEELPFQLFVEAIAFRRGRSGALVIVGALNHSVRDIQVQDLAIQLDRRFLENR
jgi:hypothetical protein